MVEYKSLSKEDVIKLISQNYSGVRESKSVACLVTMTNEEKGTRSQTLVFDKILEDK